MGLSRKKCVFRVELVDEYEADSYEEAEDMFYDDPDKYTYNPPYDSQAPSIAQQMEVMGMGSMASASQDF